MSSFTKQMAQSNDDKLMNKTERVRLEDELMRLVVDYVRYEDWNAPITGNTKRLGRAICTPAIIVRGLESYTDEGLLGLKQLFQ
jgi:hypothetical protein